MPLSDCLIARTDSPFAVPVRLVHIEGVEPLLAELGPVARNTAKATGFEGHFGQILLVQDGAGGLTSVAYGIGKSGSDQTPFGLARLATGLPSGDYVFESALAQPDVTLLGLALQTYRFERYRKAEGPLRSVRFVAPPSVDLEQLRCTVDAVAWGRDLVNTPANDLGPAELAGEAVALARRMGAAVEVISGDALREQGFPLIHAVGHGSERPPCLVDITWGNPAHPKVTLVGKGVVFDTGGLDIKPSAGMLLMKKDMGGAAAALVAARLVMESGLSVRLRVLIPIVENATSGRAMRPGDVVKSRKGLTVEINNTDAEGRLILADALALADEEAPALLLDFATLTGAARVALGPDLPPFYTRDEELASQLLPLADSLQDPVWRMPLWSPYRSMLESKVADLSNVSAGAFAGSVTAALFLERFVEKAGSYGHFDVFAWTPSARPGRPEGGEVQAARAVHALIARRWPRA